MGFAEDVRNGQHIVNKRRYELSKIVSDISKINPLPEPALGSTKLLARLILDIDNRIHTGAAIAISYALLNFHKLKKEHKLDNIIRAAFIYGGVARGLKDDRPPKDIDILVIKKANIEIPKITFPKSIDVQIYSEEFFSEEYLRQDSEQASFNRRILALPILPLYGETYLKERIVIAYKYYKFKDIDEFIIAQAKKKYGSQKINDLLNRIHVNKKDTQAREELKQIKTYMIEQLDLSEAIKEMIISNNLQE